MTAEPNLFQPPPPEPVPQPEPVSQPARRSRKPLFVVLGAAAATVLAVVLIIVFTTAGPSSVHGTLSLLCDLKCTKAAADGYDGYSDLGNGSQVTLVDETGQVVATTELRRSPGEETKIVDGAWVRTFTFTFTDVPSADRYGVHVGNNNRGTLWKSADETERDGFSLTIGG
ncbi:hypothetical protein VA596_04915 [Amycolatopsis sp., V23-08]|uniref:Uncharacterized protein n=1 Tax=Amycolatopsis heterodermiae TaxID=3110235 RepID=A0ABU5R0I0_9PSEU|nr:hypothetical protein [Amycolatopsis sp., V23-08]MEA5358866.1 hypothetical protein [Amycolatopsis sp., V23-08]